MSAQEPQLAVEVDRRRIFEGESVRYRVTLENVENPAEPTLPEIDNNFIVERLGNQTLNSRQITIINGRRSEVVRFGHQYDFRLTPKAAGTYEIPPPTVEVDGVLLEGTAVSVEVRPPADQETVFVEMSADRTAVYPMQSFTISLTIAVRDLPGELSDRSPLSVQGNQPVSVRIPWLDEPLPDGLDSDQTWRDILEPLIHRSDSFRGATDGFQINNIGSQSVFSMFGRDVTTFLPPAKRTERTLQDGSMAAFHEYQLQRTFTPQTTADVTIGAVIVKGTFATELAGGRLNGEEIYAVSRPLPIRVKEVPTEGRPSTFNGGIGSFQTAAELSPTTAAVGEPMTLSVRMTGRGTISDLQPPKIAEIPEITQHFRTYDATTESVPNGKVFTFGLRPLTSNVQEFPPIPISWFDVQQEQYVTQTTPAIPVSITEAQQLATSEIISGAPLPRSELRTSDSGLFANHSSLSELKSENAQLRPWLVTWSAMILVWAAVVVGVRIVSARAGDPAAGRRQAARSTALNRLSAAVNSDHADAQTASEVPASAVKGLIADYRNVSTAGMTSADAGQCLAEAGVDENLQQRVQQFLNDCDAARYGGDSNRADELPITARQLISELAAALEKRC
ncbi:MAG: BatD family protein [Planctomycetaceae bacterium]|nr:BatD family protein [Planctomycetaceae bacterium]